MQVIPGGIANSGTVDVRHLTAFSLTEDGAHETNDLYLIGKERTELHINQDGILHFAVNDIVLTPDIIYEMVLDNLHCIGAPSRPSTASSGSSARSIPPGRGGTSTSRASGTSASSRRSARSLLSVRSTGRATARATTSAPIPPSTGRSPATRFRATR